MGTKRRRSSASDAAAAWLEEVQREHGAPSEQRGEDKPPPPPAWPAEAHAFASERWLAASPALVSSHPTLESTAALCASLRVAHALGVGSPSWRRATEAALERGVATLRRDADASAGAFDASARAFSAGWRAATGGSGGVPPALRALKLLSCLDVLGYALWSLAGSRGVIFPLAAMALMPTTAP